LSCSRGTWANGPSSFDFEWRRDGSPIAGETADTYVVAGADVGAALRCAVTATNGTGWTTAVSDPVTGRPAPVTPANLTRPQIGVSIDNGAAYVSRPAVTLTVHEPEGAVAVLISNDGGFADASQQRIAADDLYQWTLVSTGAERLPKTVYVRFEGAGIDPSQT